MAGLNNSIFDHASSPGEVRVTDEVIKISTRKIIPKSASKKADFPGSDITFDFTLSGNQWWLPSRSFVVIRDSIYRGRNAAGADQPILGDDLAPSLNLQDNLWDGVQLTIGGFSLSSKTKLAPQISAINKRVMKSASWLDGAGASAHTWKPRFHERQNDIIKLGIVGDAAARQNQILTGTITIVAPVADNSVAANHDIVGVGTLFTEELQVGDLIETVGDQALFVQSITDDLNMIGVGNAMAAEAGVIYSKVIQGYPSSRSNKNERIYVPPLGPFHQGKALPPARYELILRPKPDTVYKQSALSTSLAEDVTIQGGDRSGGASLDDGHSEYLVDDIVFYIAVVDNHERAPSKQTYVLDLEETDVLPRKISGGDNVQENFTVSKSTFGLTVALQSKSAGRNSLYSPSRMVVEGDHQNELETLRVDYAGRLAPVACKSAANTYLDQGISLELLVPSY